MNTLKKLLTVVAMVATFASCSSSDADEIGKNPSLQNTTWEYNKPICEIEYPKDSIEISMGAAGQKMSFAPEQIVELYNSFAGEKISSYMRYFKFIDNKTMEVGYVADGEDGVINIGYNQVDKYIQVDMSVINPKMTKISVNYTIKHEGTNSYMDLYFEKAYILIMAQQMLPSFLPNMMGSIIPGFEMMPEMAQQAIITSFTSQINNILMETNSLKVGMQLKESK